MMQQTPDKLVEYARQIAKHRAHDNLENGLQSLEVLNAKLEIELQEFSEAVGSKDAYHQYHEAADLLYYSACIDTQLRFNTPRALGITYDKMLCETIAGVGLLPRSAEKAALAKYSWRSEQPGNKDEAYELKLIRMALDPDFG